MPNPDGNGSGDGNGDGIPDSQQNNVSSLPNSTTGEFVTLALEDTFTFNGLQTMDSLPNVPDPVQEADFAQGFFDFGVTGVQPGGTLSVTFILHTTNTNNLPNSYWKYGGTPDEPSDHWYQFTYDAQTGTGAKIDGNTITLHFVDGGRGDADLTVNGQIADPGAPGIYQPPTALKLTAFNGQSATPWRTWLLMGIGISIMIGMMILQRKKYTR